MLQPATELSQDLCKRSFIKHLLFVLVVTLTPSSVFAIEPTQIDPSKVDPSELDQLELDPSELDPSELENIIAFVQVAGSSRSSNASASDCTSLCANSRPTTRLTTRRTLVSTAAIGSPKATAATARAV